jgi:hypothetical protein
MARPGAGGSHGEVVRVCGVGVSVRKEGGPHWISFLGFRLGVSGNAKHGVVFLVVFGFRVRRRPTRMFNGCVFLRGFDSGGGKKGCIVWEFLLFGIFYVDGKVVGSYYILL